MLQLIDADGVGLGMVSREESLRLAQEAGLDLVEVNPKSDPPIAKIMDYGQFKYERDKKLQKQKTKSKKSETKCVRLSVRIGVHDFNTRIEQAKKFLTRGDKLKVELRLKGRERQHPETGREVLVKFMNEMLASDKLNLEIEEALTKQGETFNMVLVNKKS
jgi:translation initiation factor IF-3